jgi:hypothetical protein
LKFEVDEKRREVGSNPIVVTKVAWWLKEEDERDKQGVLWGRKENMERIV